MHNKKMWLPLPEWQNQKGELWPEGWYVYQPDKIHGPFSIVSIQSFAPQMEQLWITRKGFKSWYPFEKLQYKIQENRPEQSFDSFIKKCTNLKNTKNFSKSQVFPQPQQPSQNDDTQPRYNRLQIEYAHLLNRGKYRLGRNRQLFSNIIPKMIMTGGLYWIYWYYSIASEILLHLDHPFAEKMIHRKWLCAVPFLHMIMTYRLTKVILQMETRNGYKTVSPTLAFCLSIVPVFSVAYLQRSLNLHWFLHNLHSMQKSTIFQDKKW